MQWGPGGVPQPLSAVLGGGGGGSQTGGAGVGGHAGGFSDEGGRFGDDDTSDEEGGYDYKAAARQLWSGPEDDSEDEVGCCYY